MNIKAILIFGPPASGKNTIGKLLHQQLQNSKYLHNHAIVDLITELFPFQSQEAKDLTLSLRKEIFMTWAKGNTKKNILISTQALNKSATEHIQLYQDFCKSYVPQEILIINITAKIETIMQRALNPDRLNHRKVEAAKVQEYIQKNSDQWDINFHQLFPTAKIISIDSDKLSAEESSELILENITN